MFYNFIVLYRYILRANSNSDVMLANYSGRYKSLSHRGLADQAARLLLVALVLTRSSFVYTCLLM